MKHITCIKELKFMKDVKQKKKYFEKRIKVLQAVRSVIFFKALKEVEKKAEKK